MMNKLGIVVKSLEDGSQNNVADVLGLFITEFREVRPTVSPWSSHANACVVAGDEVLMLRREEYCVQQLSLDSARFPEDFWNLAVEWREMCETLKKVSTCIGVKKAGQGVVGMGKLAWRKEGAKFLRERMMAANDRRSKWREQAQALRMCEDKGRDVSQRFPTRHRIRLKNFGCVRATSI